MISKEYRSGLNGINEQLIQEITDFLDCEMRHQ